MGVNGVFFTPQRIPNRLLSSGFCSILRSLHTCKEPGGSGGGVLCTHKTRPFLRGVLCKCRPFSINRSETAIFVTEAIDRMGDPDSIPKARLLYCSTPFMSPRSSSILTEDGAELPSRSKKKKSEAVFLPPQSGGVPQLFSTSLSHCSPLVRCSSRPQLAHPSACRRAGQREGRCPSRAGQNSGPPASARRHFDLDDRRAGSSSPPPRWPTLGGRQKGGAGAAGCESAPQIDRGAPLAIPFDFASHRLQILISVVHAC